MAFNFKHNPIDRRRMTFQDRNDYDPSQRQQAVQRSQNFKANMKFNRNADEFRTEQSPGTGGLTGGIWQQQLRTQNQSIEKERAESFRPEKAISSDITSELFSINDDAMYGTSKDRWMNKFDSPLIGKPKLNNKLNT